MISFWLSVILTVFLHSMLRYVTKHTELQICLNRREYMGYSVAHFLCCFITLRASSVPGIVFCYMLILGPAVIIDLKYRTVFVCAFFFPAAVALISCFIHGDIYMEYLSNMQIVILIICMAFFLCTTIFKWQGMGDIYVAGSCMIYFVNVIPNMAGIVFALFLLTSYVLFIVVLFVCKLKGYKKWTLPLVPFFYISFVINAILI